MESVENLENQNWKYSKLLIQKSQILVNDQAGAYMKAIFQKKKEQNAQLALKQDKKSGNKKINEP